MDTSRLGPVYLFGIVLNLIALAYALSTEAYLYALAFVLVIAYLSLRYRMFSSD